ncbi:hypothetical protein DACRYDRAFT_108685 [Dacryopinax primogenitus]|uniref:Uncharacterized protein n=1 Tax=Dacryopinax primogenitus (strain DJM 731) TaxID=1858805 RepID=M5FSX3_DACPD|nr:uncharacterized protein DACRYDRAFT_108685 [Dacryopinax primogenitus]EJU00621.1 hypothetical protein DACRYDRAFT_108685 [Dacryopinax primogenitus]
MAGMHHMRNCNESDAMIMDVPLPTNTLSKKKVGTKGKGNKENLPTLFCNATSVVLALSTEDDLDEDPVETLVEPEKHALSVSDIKEDEPLPKHTKKQPLKQLDNGLDMQKFLSKKKSKKEELIEVNARIVELGAIIMSMKAKLAKHRAPLPLKVIAKPLGQPGHKGPGGYCLQEEMGLSGNKSKYNSIQQQVQQISNKYNVCGDKTITKLHPEVMAKIYKEAQHKILYLARFENDWATRAIVKSYTRNAKQFLVLKKAYDEHCLPGSGTLGPAVAPQPSVRSILSNKAMEQAAVQPDNDNDVNSDKELADLLAESGSDNEDSD